MQAREAIYCIRPTQRRSTSTSSAHNRQPLFHAIVFAPLLGRHFGEALLLLAALLGGQLPHHFGVRRARLEGKGGGSSRFGGAEHVHLTKGGGGGHLGKGDSSSNFRYKPHAGARILNELYCSKARARCVLEARAPCGTQQVAGTDELPMCCGVSRCLQCCLLLLPPPRRQQQGIGQTVLGVIIGFCVGALRRRGLWLMRDDDV